MRSILFTAIIKDTVKRNWLFPLWICGSQECNDYRPFGVLVSLPWFIPVVLPAIASVPSVQIPMQWKSHDILVSSRQGFWTMIFLNGSPGLQCCSLGKVKAFTFLKISTVSVWSCNKIIRTMPQWGPPMEPRLMTCCSGFSLFLVELNCQEWESKILIKLFSPQGLERWGRNSRRCGLVALPSLEKHNGTHSNVSENLVTRVARGHFALKLFHPQFCSFCSSIWRLQTHPSICQVYKTTLLPSCLCSRYWWELRAGWPSCILTISYDWSYDSRGLARSFPGCWWPYLENSILRIISKACSKVKEWERLGLSPLGVEFWECLGIAFMVSFQDISASSIAGWGFTFLESDSLVIIHLSALLASKDVFISLSQL